MENSQEVSNWILTFLTVYYYKWTNEPQTLRVFYRESSTLSRRMEAKTNNATAGEDAAGLDQCMKRIEQCGRLCGDVTIHMVDHQTIRMEPECLLINVIGIVRPKNLMDGTPPRSFTHTFVLMKFLDGLDPFGKKTKLWHIHNDIFRYLPPQQLNLATMSSGYNLTANSGIYQAPELYPPFDTENVVSSSPPHPTFVQRTNRVQTASHRPAKEPAVAPIHQAPFVISTHPGATSSVVGPTHPPNLPLPSPPHYTAELPRTETRNEPSSIYGDLENRVVMPPMDKHIPAPIPQNQSSQLFLSHPSGHLEVPPMGGLPPQSADTRPQGSTPSNTDPSLGIENPPEESVKAGQSGIGGGGIPGGGGVPSTPVLTPTIPAGMNDENTSGTHGGRKQNQDIDQIPRNPVSQACPGSWAGLLRGSSTMKAAAQPLVRQQRPPPGNKRENPAGGPPAAASMDEYNANRGQRRKGRGRGGGQSDRRQQNSPRKKNQYFLKPAIFFQPKEQVAKPFHDLGVTEQHAKDMFSKYGKVINVDIRPKFGFIYFESEEGRDEAIGARETNINGVAIRIEKKKPQTQRRNRGGPERRGRGGRGGWKRFTKNFN